MDKETGLPEGASTYSAGTNTDPWTEVRIEVPAERIDAAGDIAHMTVPYGIYLEDYRFLEEEIDEIAHIDLIDEALKDKDRTKGVVHIYLEPGENPAEAVAFLQEQYAQAGIPSELTVIPCRNEDWQDNWKKLFKPTEVGQKLLIQPVWEVEGSTSVEPTSDVEPQDVPSTDRKILYLEPGLAFGTGTHETTRLCLQTLEETIRGGETVLDLGCGSGILSIAALLFGASRAEGVDIDELAVKTAVENGRRNGFEGPVLTYHCGDMAKQVSGTFDIVVANIVADIIVLFCETARNFMKEGSVFIVSGILNTREQDVLDAFAANGFEVVSRKADGEWLCFTVR